MSPPITDLLRSRGGQSRNNASSNRDGPSKPTQQQHLLPLHNSNNNGTTTTTPTTPRSTVSNISSNSFLLGGMYVPNKDKRKRRRMVHRHRTSNSLFSTCIETCENVYIRYPFIILCVGIFFVVGIIISHQNNNNSRRNGNGVYDRGPRQPREWKRRTNNKNNNVDWLLQDQTLLHRLPSLQDEQKRVTKFVHERYKYQHQRFKLLESFVPEWYHRNDPITTVATTTKEAEIEKNDGSIKNGEIVLESQHKMNQANMDHESDKELVGDTSDLHSVTHVHATTSNRIRYTLQNNIHNFTSPIASPAIMTSLNAPSSCPINLSSTNTSISLLMQSSIDRLWILRETCQRWKSPMIVVVAVHDPLDTEANAMLQSYIVQYTRSCQQLQIILYHLDTDAESTPETYPVNTLRNVALDAVTTSHILMIDIDFVPSLDLDVMIQSTVQKEEQQSARNSTAGTSSKIAMVIPAFDRVLHPPCTSMIECSQHLQNNSQFIPFDFQELTSCYNNDNCIIFQSMDNWEGHSSTRTEFWLQKKWYNNDNDTERASRTIPCFDSLRYEPYVVLRWCPISSSKNTTSGIVPVAPYYDERFHGYGKNKIQLISHLRLMGYQFTILPHGGFIVHNPHVESSSKLTWNNIQQQPLHHNMDVLYQTFLNELVSIYLTGTVNGGTSPKDIVMACTRRD